MSYCCIAVVQTVQDICEFHDDDKLLYVTDVAIMYRNRLEELGAIVPN